MNHYATQSVSAGMYELRVKNAARARRIAAWFAVGKKDIGKRLKPTNPLYNVVTTLQKVHKTGGIISYKKDNVVINASMPVSLKDEICELVGDTEQGAVFGQFIQTCSNGATLKEKKPVVHSSLGNN